MHWFRRVGRGMGWVGGGALVGDCGVVTCVVAVVSYHHPAAVWEIHEILTLSAVASALL